MIRTVGRVELDPTSKIPVGVHCADELTSRGATEFVAATVSTSPAGPQAVAPLFAGSNLLVVLTGLRLGQTYAVTWHYTDDLGWEDDVSLEVACVDF